jgi:YtxH-like protein
VRKWYQLLTGFPHLDTGEYCSSGEVKMGSRKDKVLLNVLLGTGAFLLDSWRNRMGGTVEEFRSKAQDTYETASDRVSRASDVIRGEDSNVLGTAAAALLGLGIGIGVGLLLAPASGEETRNNLASKARDIRDRVSSRAAAATGD